MHSIRRGKINTCAILFVETAGENVLANITDWSPVNSTDEFKECIFYNQTVSFGNVAITWWCQLVICQLISLIFGK